MFQKLMEMMILTTAMGAMSPKAVFQVLAKTPEYTGKAYRVDIENWGIPRDATAADIIRFEEQELGNIYGLSESLLKELDKYSYKDVVWVGKTKGSVKQYLSEGMTAKDISEVNLPLGSKIIADDGCGGFLVLRGDARSTRKKI